VPACNVSAGICVGWEACETTPAFGPTGALDDVDGCCAKQVAATHTKIGKNRESAKRGMQSLRSARKYAATSCAEYYTAWGSYSGDVAAAAIDSVNGARRTPCSVMIAVMYFAGVTSKAGFSMATP
jgi:hypothetical protein